MSEWNLSDKINEGYYKDIDYSNLDIEDVREFIKKLKDETMKDGEPMSIITFHEWIDKLAGDKLNGSTN